MIAADGFQGEKKKKKMAVCSSGGPQAAQAVLVLGFGLRD